MEYFYIGVLTGIYLLLLLTLNKFVKQKKYLYFAISLLIFLQFAFRSHLTDDFWNVYNGVALGTGTEMPRYVKNPNFFASYSRWALSFCIIMIPVTLCSKNNIFRQITAFAGVPLMIFAISAFNVNMNYFEQGNLGQGIIINLDIRQWLYMLELALLLASALFIFITNSARFKLVDLKKSAIFAPLLFLICVPVNIPQTLLGYGNIRFTFFSAIGLFTYTMMILLIIFLYKRLKEKNKETQWSIIYFMTFLMLVQYTYANRYELSNPELFYHLPLQLCNIGVYLTMIAIIFKWQKLFDMLMIVNLQGTVVALVVVNTVESNGIYSFWQLHYLYEHILLFMVPILATALGLFKMVSRKSLRNGFIGFSIYFYFSLLAGTYINGLDPAQLRKVDYFYVFKDIITRTLPVTNYFKELSKWYIGKYTIYPLFYLVVHLGYSSFLLLTYRAIFYFQRTYIEHKEINALRKKMWKERHAKNI